MSSQRSRRTRKILVRVIVLVLALLICGVPGEKHIKFQM